MNRSSSSLSVEAAYEICNQFRETLKPVFKLLTQKVYEIDYEIQNVIPTVDEVNTVLSENYVLKNDVYTTEQADEKFVDEDELAYELDKYVMKEEMPTVDLTPYALKSDVINKYVPTTTFSGYVKSADEKYRQKDDLSVNTIINLHIEHKTPTYGEHEFSGETAFVEFHEGALLEGYAIVYDAGIEDYVHRDFSITFHTDWTDGDRYMCDTIISADVEGFWWEENTNAFYAAGDIDIAVHLNSTKLYIEDTFALKYEIEELKTTISSLEARLAALENK